MHDDHCSATIIFIKKMCTPSLRISLPGSSFELCSIFLPIYRSTDSSTPDLVVISVVLLHHPTIERERTSRKNLPKIVKCDIHRDNSILLKIAASYLVNHWPILKFFCICLYSGYHILFILIL